MSTVYHRSLKDKIRNLSSNPTTPPENIWVTNSAIVEVSFICSVCFTVSSCRLDRIFEILAPKSSYPRWLKSMRPRRRTTPLTYVCSSPKKNVAEIRGPLAVVSCGASPLSTPVCLQLVGYGSDISSRAIMGAGLRKPAARCERGESP